MKKFFLFFLLATAFFGAQAKSPKHVILMIGDGMGLPQIALTEAYTGHKLALCEFPVVGIATTHAADSEITDSAAAGTALATGNKTSFQTVGMTPDDTKPLKNLSERAREKGMKVAVITTAPIEDATPAAFTAHVPDRYMSDEILAQQAASGYEIIEGDIDSLALAVNNGFAKLAGRDGFFMMAEGGMIDKVAHNNDAPAMIAEVLDFDSAVRAALDFYYKHPRETLIIVTADHETGGLTLGSREMEYKSDFRKLEGISWATGAHTALPVPVFAIGVGAEKFAGYYDNTEIAKKINL